jgi:hypothetical protein
VARAHQSAGAIHWRFDRKAGAEMPTPAIDMADAALDVLRQTGGKPGAGVPQGKIC